MVNKEKIKEMDSHWTEVMNLAEKYGFLCQAFAGTATLATHKNQVETFEEKEYLHRQKELFRIDMSICDEE